MSKRIQTFWYSVSILKTNEDSITLNTNGILLGLVMRCLWTFTVYNVEFQPVPQARHHVSVEFDVADGAYAVRAGVINCLDLPFHVEQSNFTSHYHNDLSFAGYYIFY